MLHSTAFHLQILVMTPKLVLSPTAVTHSLKNTGQIICMAFLNIQTILYVTMHDSNVIKR